MTNRNIVLLSAFAAASLTAAAAQPALVPGPLSRDELAKACEATVREKASVVSIISGEAVALDARVQRYRITFQGPGDIVTVTCLRPRSGAIVMVINQQQSGRPAWGTDRRPAEIPVGASPCDTLDEANAFRANAAGPDAGRLIPSLATRQGDTLTLTLHGGTGQVQFTDETSGCVDGNPDCTHYRFLAWVPQHDAYVVYVQGYESVFMFVVNAGTGQRLGLIGFPVWSPSGRWVAADSMSGPIDNISLGVWDWPAQRQVFGADWGDGTFCVHSWIGDSALHVEGLRQPGKPGEAFDRTPRTVTLANGNWQLSR